MFIDWKVSDFGFRSSKMGQKRFLHEKVNIEIDLLIDMNPRSLFHKKNLFYAIFDAEFEKNIFNSFGDIFINIE